MNNSSCPHSQTSTTNCLVAEAQEERTTALFVPQLLRLIMFSLGIMFPSSTPRRKIGETCFFLKSDRLCAGTAWKREPRTIRGIIWKMISVPQSGKNVVVGEVWVSGWGGGSGQWTTDDDYNERTVGNGRLVVHLNISSPIVSSMLPPVPTPSAEVLFRRLLHAARPSAEVLFHCLQQGPLDLLAPRRTFGRLENSTAVHCLHRASIGAPTARTLPDFDGQFFVRRSLRPRGMKFVWDLGTTSRLIVLCFDCSCFRLVLFPPIIIPPAHVRVPQYTNRDRQ